MVGGDSTGPGLQLFGARFLNFLPGKLCITRVQTLPYFHISRYSNGRISVVRDATVTCLGLLLVLHVPCISM